MGSDRGEQRARADGRSERGEFFNEMILTVDNKIDVSSNDKSGAERAKCEHRTSTSMHTR